MRLLSEKHSVRQRRVSRIKVFSKKKKNYTTNPVGRRKGAREKRNIYPVYWRNIGGVNVNVDSRSRSWYRS